MRRVIPLTLVPLALVLAAADPAAPPPGDWTSPTVGAMRWIPAGSFTMGSPRREPGRLPDETQHPVTLTRGFLLMEHEVTQGEWAAVMGANPSLFHECGPSCPVDNVSWSDAVAFANAVSVREGLAPVYTIAGPLVTVEGRADGYRLPTEAEWEYAARAGQPTLYAGGDDPGAVAWYGVNSSVGTRGYVPHAVCGKARNAFGLCDMSGNVWEWVWDGYGPYTDKAIDPSGPPSPYRVFRGGAWDSPAPSVRVAVRTYIMPAVRSFNLGLRLARSGAASPP